MDNLTSFDDNQLYRKEQIKTAGGFKTKYIPVYGVNWTDMARPGLWLVQYFDGCVSRKNISLYLGDLPELYPFANMVGLETELAMFIHKQTEKQYSYSTLAIEILKWLAAKDLENRKTKDKKAEQTDKELKEWNGVN